MLSVMIVPTGIGCEIGGHAGDATPAARLLAVACDTLILHPNVVNASDINEAPHNSLYVDGGMLDAFLRAECNLVPVKSNRLLVAVNKPVKPDTINAVSAARATLGIEAKIVELHIPLKLKGSIKADGTATGTVTGADMLVGQLAPILRGFDALAITSKIEVDPKTTMRYLKEGGVNPWGAVEAIATRLIGEKLRKPVAHAPLEDENADLTEVCDPRQAAEWVSVCFLHCVLKGLHRAPRRVHSSFRTGISVRDVDCLVSPYGCFGEPHRECLCKGIPVIVVRENKTVLNEPEHESFIYVNNYHEAAGVMLGIKEGISRSSIRRPLPPTVVEEIK